MSRSRIVSITPHDEQAVLAAIVSPFILYRMNDGYEGGTSIATISDAAPTPVMATDAMTIQGAGTDVWEEPVGSGNDGFIYPDGIASDEQYVRNVQATAGHEDLVDALNPYYLHQAGKGQLIVRALFKINTKSSGVSAEIFNIYGGRPGGVRCTLNSSGDPIIGLRTDSTELNGGATTATVGRRSLMWVWDFSASTMTTYVDAVAGTGIAIPAGNMLTTAALITSLNAGVNWFCRGTGASAQTDHLNAGVLDAERLGVAEMFVCRCNTDISADLATIAQKWVTNPRQTPSEFMGA